MHMFIINITNLVGTNLEIGTERLVLEGKPPHQLAPRMSFYPKTSTFGRQHELSPFVEMPL